MKKMIASLCCLCMLMAMTGCSIELPFGNSEPTEETVPTPPPTLEEMLGFTGYDLLKECGAYKYQEVNLVAEIELTAMVNARGVGHSIKEVYAHKADEDTSYTLITSTDTSETSTLNQSAMAYVDITQNTLFYNNNYTGWKYTSYTTDNQYFDESMVENVIVDLMEQDGDNLRVTGSVSTLGNSSLDTFIKHILSQYGSDGNGVSYTYSALINGITQDIITLKTEVTIPTDIAYGESTATITKMSVSYTPVGSDDVSILDIPTHIFESSVSDAEPTPEPVEPTDEYVFNPDDIITTSLCRGEPTEEVVVAYLNEAGYTEEYLTGKTMYAYSDFIANTVEFMTTQSYNSMLAIDTNELTGVRNYAYNIVLQLLQEREGT